MPRSLSSRAISSFYRCQGKQVVALEVLASSDRKSHVAVFKRRWSCSPRGHVRAIRVELPDRLVYREDDIIRHPIAIRRLELRAWISDDQRSSRQALPAGGGGFERGATRTSHLLQPIPLLRRPFKAHPRTHRWDQEILWSLWKARGLQCKAPLDAEPLLTFPFASSGEKFGVLKVLEPQKDTVLEKLRLQHITSARCTISIWLFLASPCPVESCGILYHLSTENEYTTPTLLLTQTGYLHLQVELESRHQAAVRSLSPIPQFRWCRVTVTLKGRLVNFTTACEEGGKMRKDSFVHTLARNVYLDDTQGWFVFGGSEHIPGIHGFLGPSHYYRSSVLTPYQAELPELLRGLDLPRWFVLCQKFKKDISAQLRLYQLRRTWVLWQESCHTEYGTLAVEDRARSPEWPQCKAWDSPVPRRRAVVYTLLRQVAWRTGDHLVKSASLGRMLYRRFEKQVIQDLTHLEDAYPLLLQAGCLGCSQALYVLSVLHQVGFRLDLDPTKALKFSLLSAQADHRLSEMRLGHKHHLGVDGLPVDHDLSYAYYSNVASQTLADREQSRKEQAFVEHIRLIDKDVLKLQTKEDEDVFVWLRFQARRGVAKAQQAVSRMLFWGQQGVSSNLEAAVKFYEKGATQLQDPTLMYDYGVVLLKGQGVTQDTPKALEFLNRAAEQGFPRALTAMGWYYHVFESDYRRAVEFWEKADELGDSEAASNLGVFYASGLYPDKPKDEVAAYRYFWKSANRGHTDGAVKLAAYFSRGIAGTLPRTPRNAVLWAKWVSEQNGFLGAALRKALDAYLQQSWPATLLYYLLSAEAGLSVAQFNMGYLCDQDPEELISRHLQANCPWKYYNLSILSERPASYALLGMGDLIYSSSSHSEREPQDVQAAVKMYKAAALQQDPQGLYNLGLLVEEGVSIPKASLQELGLNGSVWASNYMLLVELYRRCRDQREEHSFVPCSLALFNTHLQHLWAFHGSIVKFSGLAAVALITGLSFLSVLCRLRNRTVDQLDPV